MIELNIEGGNVLEMQHGTVMGLTWNIEATIKAIIFLLLPHFLGVYGQVGKGGSEEAV